MFSAFKLDHVYRQESNPDLRERILLVKHVVDDKQHIVNVVEELHRCRAWAYKWYKTYDDDGLHGLKTSQGVVGLDQYQKISWYG
jgi:hypothetical protein